MPPARKATKGLLFSLSGRKGQGGERGEGNARVISAGMSARRLGT